MNISKLKLQHFIFFLDIAKGKNFFEAAIEHDITQATFSKAIMRLEDEIGSTLIDRGHYPVSLTPAGKQLYKDLQEMMPAIQSSIFHMKAYSQRTQIKMTVVPSLANYRIQHLVDRFTLAHPEIPVSINDSENPHDTLKALQNEEIDFCIMHKPFTPLTLLRTRVLTKEPLFVIMPKAHKLASRESVSLVDLYHETFIASRYSYTILQDICNTSVLSLLNIKKGVPRPTVISSIEAGQGITLYYKSDIDMFRLDNVVIKQIEEITDNPVILGSLGSNELSASQKLFSDFLASAFANENSESQAKQLS